MLGTICAPTRYMNEVCLTDRYSLLLETLAKELNWKMLYSDKIRRRNLEGDKLLLFKIPINDRMSQVLRADEIPRHTKVISYITDLQPNTRLSGNRYATNSDHMFNRATFILCPNENAFKQQWGQYASKLVFFPHFIAPIKRYKRSNTTNNQIKKALLIGLVSKHEYPFRLFLRQSKSDLIKNEPHPGDKFNLNERLKKGFKLRDVYAETINQYVCTVTSGSRYHYVLGKHFEIPAANSILLANTIPELAKCGFIANKHYVPISKENALQVISDVIQNPQQYEHIRERARALVFSKHTIEHRVKQLIQIIEMLGKK